MSEKVDLLISIGVDIIGMASYLLPGVGEASDIVVAPLTTIWILRMVEKTGEGRLDEIIDLALGLGGGAEELGPFTDIIPSATIAWFYAYKVAS